MAKTGLEFLMTCSKGVFRATTRLWSGGCPDASGLRYGYRRKKGCVAMTRRRYAG